MCLVDFLILLLQAHAEGLKDLSNLIGEEKFLNALSITQHEPHFTAAPSLRLLENNTVLRNPDRRPLQKIETAVKEMDLPKSLENYLWEYPHYRAFVESSIDLETRIESPNQKDSIGALVDEATITSQAWLNKLRIPPETLEQAEGLTRVHWIKFRTDILKQIGKPVLTPIA